MPYRIMLMNLKRTYQTPFTSALIDGVFIWKLLLSVIICSLHINIKWKIEATLIEIESDLRENIESNTSKIDIEA